MSRNALASAAVVLGAALFASCSPSHESVTGSLAESPSSTALEFNGRPRVTRSGVSYFPLELGNRWRFHYHFSVRVQPDGAPAYDESAYDTELEHLVACTEPQGALDYRVMRMSYSDPDVNTRWIRYREDRDGLYEYDEAFGPPACDSDDKGVGGPSKCDLPGHAMWTAAAARLHPPAQRAAWEGAWTRLHAKRASLAGLSAFLDAGASRVTPDEIQRLAYPLHPGQAWQIREELNFRSVVERAVVLRTPAGRFATWSIRIFNDLLGSGDVVRVWYGRQGYLGLDAVLSSPATDQNGNVFGTVVAHQSETLIDIRIRRASHHPVGRFAADGGAQDD